MAKPIPHGMHTATISLTVQDSSAMIDFYKKVFGAQELFRMPGPDGKTIMHAEVKIGDSIIMLNDEFPKMNCRSPKSVGGTSSGIYLYVDDVDSTVKKAVENGAKLQMPVMDMFWGDRLGNIEDPSGHMWSVATHIKDMTPEEMAKAGQEAMKNCQ